jgi:hypothetical protein
VVRDSPARLFHVVARGGSRLHRAALMLRSYYTFRLTILFYVLLASYACIILIRGDFTCAKVPLFDWVRDSISRRVRSVHPYSRDSDTAITAPAGQMASFFCRSLCVCYSSGRSPCGLGDAPPGSRIERWNGYSAGSLSSNSCAKSSTAVCSLISAASASLLAVRPKWAQS